MSEQTVFSVTRIYKNSSGEVLRIDRVFISGTFMRKNIFSNWGGGWTATRPANVPNQPAMDWGDWRFLSNGSQKVGSDILQVTTSRVVAEVEIIGAYETLSAAPNYESATFRGGAVTLDMSQLPVVGDSV